MSQEALCETFWFVLARGVVLVMVVELAADYYLVNFKQLIAFVARSYAGLLSHEELAFERDFQALPENAQKLYVRLLCRSKSVFRLAKLKYPEIDDLPAAAVQLAEVGFIAINDIDEIESLLQLFTRAEIMQRVSLPLPRNAKRPAIVAALLEHPEQSRICAALSHEETLLSVRQQAHFELYKLCFFGNLYQDMTDFVLRDLGLTRYENYPISAENQAFQSRQQIDAHLQYYACVEALDDVLTGDSDAITDLHRRLPTTNGADPNLTRRVERLTNTLARQLERLGELETALDLYRQTRRPPSRERQARVLVSLGSPAAALDICRELLVDPFNDEEKQFAEQFSARLAKSLELDWPARVRYRPPTEALVLQRREVNVELLAAEYYARQGQCFYTENVLFTAVFGLAFWDIIFVSLKGVFFNPFQLAPADFHEPEFRLARKELLQQRWSSLANAGELQRICFATFEQKQGLQNPMVQWQYLSRELLEAALSRIPLAHWLSVFRRLLEDLRYNRNGFPDLVLFPEAGGYCLVEVKGPGDTVQKNQLRWMAYFAANEMPHKVSHISWADSGESPS